MRRAFLYGAALILAIAGCTSTATQHRTTVTSQGASVLLVCNGSTVRCPALPGSAGPYYRTVQEAVDAARPGDWVLIYPGVYHEGARSGRPRASGYKRLICTSADWTATG